MASHSKTTHYVQPWHFDCRLSKELPDDNPVRGRFLAVLFAGAIAAVALFHAGITLYNHSILRTDIAYWDNQIKTNSVQMAELQKAISSIQTGAKRLDEINKLTATPLAVSDFIQEIGRSRPANVRIDMIEYHDGSAYIRGGLRESSQRASAVLSQYVGELKANPRLRSLFQSIAQTGMDRNILAGTMSFEINLKLKTATR
jgi:Tfp pilus assembly protein PilN